MTAVGKPRSHPRADTASITTAVRPRAAKAVKPPRDRGGWSTSPAQGPRRAPRSARRKAAKVAPIATAEGAAKLVSQRPSGGTWLA